MRFMIIVKATPESEAGTPPTEAQLANMTSYNEELLAAGVLIGGEGLRPSARGVRVHVEDGRQVFTDGPFAETAALVAGFTLIEVSSREEALQWLRRWPHGPEDGDVELELREVQSAEDLGEAFTAALQAREQAMRDQVDGNRGGS